MWQRSSLPRKHCQVSRSRQYTYIAHVCHARLRGLSQPRACGAAPARPTICDPALRTVNTGAPCGSKDDFYFYTPWRYPGRAPVIDACGSAGGRWPGQAAGPYGAQFQNTSLAKAGDKGSALPKLAAAKTVWTLGTAAEVAWSLTANHGKSLHERMQQLSLRAWLCPIPALRFFSCRRRLFIPSVSGRIARAH